MPVKTTKPKSKKEVSLDAVGLEAGKKPPQALDVEEAVLGAMLIEPNAVPDVLDSLTADCFYKCAPEDILCDIQPFAGA